MLSESSFIESSIFDLESGFSIVESGFLKRESEHEPGFFPSPGFLRVRVQVRSGFRSMPLRCSFTATSIAKIILLKQFSLAILYIKHRNVVTLDRNFKRTQDEIARKNLRQNYRLLLFAFTSLNERPFILVYGTKLNRDVNTHETLEKTVSIQHEINGLLAKIHAYKTNK